MNTFESKLYDIDKYSKSNKNLHSYKSITLDFVKITHSNECITIQREIDKMLKHAHARE